jgi:hypothetical protein
MTFGFGAANAESRKTDRTISPASAGCRLLRDQLRIA